MGAFADTLFSVLLSWVQSAVGSIVTLVQSGGDRGLLAFLGNNWLFIVLVLVAGGLVVDWLIWLLRWQPYHVWATRARRFKRGLLRLFGVVRVVAHLLAGDDQREPGAAPVPVGVPQGLLIAAQDGAGLSLGHGFASGVRDDPGVPVGLHGQPELSLGPLGAPAPGLAHPGLEVEIFPQILAAFHGVIPLFLTLFLGGPLRLGPKIEGDDHREHR